MGRQRAGEWVRRGGAIAGFAQIATFAKPRAVTEADTQIDIEVDSFEPRVAGPAWLGCRKRSDGITALCFRQPGGPLCRCGFAKVAMRNHKY